MEAVPKTTEHEAPEEGVVTVSGATCSSKTCIPGVCYQSSTMYNSILHAKGARIQNPGLQPSLAGHLASGGGHI